MNRFDEPRDAVCDLASRIARIPHALSVLELAELLGFGKSTIYDMASRGRIPCLRFGASIRFDPAVIAAWVREHMVGCDAENRRAA